MSLCLTRAHYTQDAFKAMVVNAGGTLCNAESTDLITMEQQLEAMKGAGKIAASDRAPGKQAFRPCDSQDDSVAAGSNDRFACAAVSIERSSNLMPIEATC